MNNKVHQGVNFIRHFFKAKRNGHGVHSPFVYRLCEDVFYSSEQFYDFKELSQLRMRLLQEQTTISFTDHGAGSVSLKSEKRTISEIAGNGISTKKQNELLYRLINHFQCANCVELGTSIGLNALYLAKANPKGKTFSIEGSEDLFRYAVKLRDGNGQKNLELILGKFREKLPELLNRLKTVDFLYVDGNHTYDDTIYHFEKAISKKHGKSIFVFDDIYWSKDMTRAWKEICGRKEVPLSLDLFHFGLVFFTEEFKEKQHIRLYW
jgi:predicted O-methyltransferase YrrM